MAMGTWRVDPQENRELQIKSGVDKKKLLGSTKQTTKDGAKKDSKNKGCLLYTSPSPRDQA